MINKKILAFGSLSLIVLSAVAYFSVSGGTNLQGRIKIAETPNDQYAVTCDREVAGLLYSNMPWLSSQGAFETFDEAYKLIKEELESTYTGEMLCNYEITVSDSPEQFGVPRNEYTFSCNASADADKLYVNQDIGMDDQGVVTYGAKHIRCDKYFDFASLDPSDAFTVQVDLQGGRKYENVELGNIFMSRVAAYSDFKNYRYFKIVKLIP